MSAPSVIRVSIADFFTSQFLLISAVPFLISFALFGFVYFNFGVDIVTEFKTSIDSGVVPFVDPEKHPIITTIFTISFFKWLFSIFFYLVGAIAMILLSVFFSVAITGFMTPLIVRIIRDRHYMHFSLKNEQFPTSFLLWRFAKTFLIFGVLLLVALPFLWIPAINFAAINIPFYYLFHSVMMLDVGASMHSKEEFLNVTKAHKLLFQSTTMPLYAISLIPLAGMIFQVLFVIILAHQFFINSEEVRA